MSVRTKSRPRSDRWWEPGGGVVAIPTVENYPVKKRRRRSRLITAYLVGIAVLFPIAILVNIVLAAQLATGGIGKETAQSSAGVDPQVAIAQTQVEKWLDSSTSPLPGGRVLAYNGSSTAAPATDKRTQQTQPDYRLNTYRFTVEGADGQLYQTSAQLVTSSQGTSLFAEPALLPLPGGVSDQAGSDQDAWPWPGVEQGTASDSFEPAIKEWADAYTSGDPAALKQAINDPNQGRTYLPLNGIKFTKIDIAQVGDLWAKGDDRQAENARPSQALVRINVSTVDDASSSDQSAQLTYDLLLDQANSASPIVVAWGSPGAQLSPYVNGVSAAAAKGTQEAAQQAQASASAKAEADQQAAEEKKAEQARQAAAKKKAEQEAAAKKAAAEKEAAAKKKAEESQKNKSKKG